MPERRKRSHGFDVLNWVDEHIGWVMVTPAVLVFLVVSLYPLVFNIWMATHNVSLLNIRAPEWMWAGARNFLRILRDPSTQGALIRTGIFASLAVALQLTLGLLGALAFNRAFRGKSALMVLALVPMMVTPIVVGISWRMLLNFDWGLTNYLIGLIGIDPMQWLSNPRLALASVILVQVWWGMSFAMLVLLGGLAAIPRSLYEAAEVDGATDLRMFLHITLPMLRPVLLVLGTIELIDALREFDLIYSLTGGGPGNATRVFALELYYTAYERGNFGMSAAQALLLMVLVLILTVPLIRLLTRKQDA